MLTAVLLVAIAQTQHDNAERAIYSALQQDREQIADIWRPSKRLVADQAKAEKCYVKFHLDKAAGCDAELDRVRVDLLSEAK
jgi:hypothetical protein